MPEICVWQEDDETTWKTECGKYFSFSNEDGPSENGFCYCCYCGKELMAVRYEPEEPEDA